MNTINIKKRKKIIPCCHPCNLAIDIFLKIKIQESDKNNDDDDDPPLVEILDPSIK